MVKVLSSADFGSKIITVNVQVRNITLGSDKYTLQLNRCMYICINLCNYFFFLLNSDFFLLVCLLLRLFAREISRLGRFIRANDPVNLHNCQITCVGIILDYAGMRGQSMICMSRIERQ